MMSDKNWFRCIVFYLGVFLCGLVSVNGETPAVKAEAQKLVQSLRGSSADFQQAIASAREKGVPEQTIFEAEILRGVVQMTADELSGLLERIDAFDFSAWDYSASTFTGTESKLMGVVAAVRAKSAYLTEDAASFEKYAKEAFWMDPDLGAVVAQWIKEERQKQQMANLVFPMETVLSKSVGEETTLAQLVSGKKAILIDFWASWCGPCMNLMPELAKKAEKLEPKGIVVVGMNTEDKATAEKIRKEREIGFPWLVEPESRPFSKLLMIDTLPRIVLVSPEGKILFNGHPSDPELEAVLAKLG